MFVHKNNINSRFYLKENKFRTNPKFISLELLKLLQKDKKISRKNDIVFMDIGCGAGALIDYLLLITPNWNFIGTEIEKDFVNYCKKNIKDAKFYLDDLKKTPNKKMPLADIVYLSGVHSHFDDPEEYINGTIRRCKKKSKIIIHGLFNPYDIDVLIKYKKSNDYNLNKKIIDQTGWNMFSVQTMNRIINTNKYIKNSKFVYINFPKKINIIKNNLNYIRSWTQKINKKKYFINGLNLIQHQYFLVLNLNKKSGI